MYFFLLQWDTTRLIPPYRTYLALGVFTSPSIRQVSLRAAASILPSWQDYHLCRRPPIPTGALPTPRDLRSLELHRNDAPSCQSLPLPLAPKAPERHRRYIPPSLLSCYRAPPYTLPSDNPFISPSHSIGRILLFAPPRLLPQTPLRIPISSPKHPLDNPPPLPLLQRFAVNIPDARQPLQGSGSFSLSLTSLPLPRRLRDHPLWSSQWCSPCLWVDPLPSAAANNARNPKSTPPAPSQRRYTHPSRGR